MTRDTVPLMQPTLSASQSSSWKDCYCSIITSHLLTSTSQCLVAAGEALNVIGRLVVKLFHHANTGGFFFLSFGNLDDKQH